MDVQSSLAGISLKLPEGSSFEKQGESVVVSLSGVEKKNYPNAFKLEMGMVGVFIA